MYEDAWYNALVPTSQNSPDPSHTPQARRRKSLLKPDPESDHADSNRTDDVPQKTKGLRVTVGPPTATVARRAKSYGDFYRAAKSQLHKDGVDVRKKQTPTSALKTELQLGDWLAEQEEELVEAAHQDYRLYHDKLVVSQSHVDALLENVSATINLLSSLSTSFKAVQEQTSAFQAQSQEILVEEQRASKLADDIKENLSYYDLLDPISRKLNAPGAGQLVREKEFSETLRQLDGCLQYMESHPDHSESQTYRARYRLLLTRALTLIRTKFVTSLREIAAEVSKRIADRQLNDTTMSALLYGKFKVGAPELKRIGQEIKSRAAHSAEKDGGAVTEYYSLLQELYQSYAATRGKLIIPLVRKRIGEISVAASTAKDLAAFARNSISYVRSVCLDEYILWKEWFEGDESLYEFLESICDPLYDSLRPRIIHETRLVKLCELCTLIQTRYIQEQDENIEVDGTGQLDFSSLIQPALEDTQTRIVFRAQAVVREEIEKYRLKKEELDKFVRKHPAPSANRTSGQSAISGRKASVGTPTTPVPRTPIVVDRDDDYFETDASTWNHDDHNLPESWYPTLKKAVWLLSRIYRLVNSAVFDDLAHEIVHQTTNSLHRAASQITARASLTDGQLFLMKHLLILKSQIVAFDFEYVTPVVSFDFSNVTNTFWELRERGGLFNPRNLFHLMGQGLLPPVVENMLDAKVELDGRLRTVIHDFTHGFADRVTADLAQPGLRKQGSDAAAAVQRVRKAVEKESLVLRRSLDSYLDDARIKETLVMAVHEQVVQNYERFYEQDKVGRHMNGKITSVRGKGREDEVRDPDAFAEWARKIFRVQNADIYNEDVDDGSRNISPASSV